MRFAPRADSSWAQTIEKNLNNSKPVKNRTQKGKYIVTVIFMIAKDGMVGDVKCEKESEAGMSEAVLQEIKKSMLPIK